MKKLITPLVLVAGIVFMFSGCDGLDSTADEPSALVPLQETVSAASATTESMRFPVVLDVFVSCAAGGAGEVIHLEGTLHSLFHMTSDGAGGFHVKSHFQPQQLTGLGLTTGAKYQGTGVTQEQFNAKVGQTYTFVNNFRMIGQGPGNNFTVHENVHVTFNANGTLTSTVDNFRTECK